MFWLNNEKQRRYIDQPLPPGEGRFGPTEFMTGLQYLLLLELSIIIMF